MDLVQFLEERIGEAAAPARAEVELVAKFYDSEFTVNYKWSRQTEHVSGGYGSSFAAGAPTPKQVLADCAAKRRIIDGCRRVLSVGSWEYTDAPDLADSTLHALALPYAAHPDYREEWRTDG